MSQQSKKGYQSLPARAGSHCQQVGQQWAAGALVMMTQWCERVWECADELPVAK